MSSTKKYKVTAIVSVYTAEQFLRGCLEDLVQQSLFEDTEVLIIDACSPENEQAIAHEFTQKYPNIHYLRTAERETLYASWNRGIHMAKGEYITNANADDRHAPHAFERLVAELDAHPDVALVYASNRITDEKNALFPTARIKRQLTWLPYTHINLLRHCEVGAQPMWRKVIHEKIGYFDASFTVAGDYDLWLRMADVALLRHIPEELGLILEYDNNLESQNPQRSFDETYKTKSAALRRFMQPDFTPHIPFMAQFRIHASRIAKIMQQVQQGKSPENVNHLEYEFFAYALLAARLGNTTQSLEILNIFFSLVRQSRNICDLYRFLLLTSNGEFAGQLRHESAPVPPVIPHIRLVLPLGAQEKYLEEVLITILAQSETRWELCILHENAPSSYLQQLLEKHADSRIKTTTYSHNDSIKAINNAIKESPTSYICILNADDLLAPSYLHSTLSLLHAHTDISWIWAQSLSIGQENTILWKNSLDFSQEHIQCPHLPAMVFRKELWEKLGGFIEDMPIKAEKDFWIRAEKHGWKGRNTPQVQYIVRIMGN